MTSLLWAAALGGTLSAAAGAFAQSTGAPSQAELVAVAGCLVQEDATWVLVSATEPLTAPAPPGAAPADRDGSARVAAEASRMASMRVTADMANRQPPGKRRYRLIGVLEEFTLASHRGHKMLVRGLLVPHPQDTRINVTSVAMAASTCTVQPSRR